MRRIVFALWITAAACAGTTASGTRRTPDRPAGATAGGRGEHSDMAGPRTQTVDQQAVHTLSRLTFGARPGDLELIRDTGIDAWIDEQLHPERIEDAAAEAWLAQFEAVRKTTGDLEREYPNPGVLVNQLSTRGGGLSPEDSVQVRTARQNLRRIADEVQIARVGHALLTERQLLEVMTEFWLNHFSVFAGKGVREQYYLADYEHRVIRPRALGQFRDLLGAVAKSPAMLFYLDNWESAADSSRPRLVAARRAGAASTPRAPAAQQLQRRLRAGLNENYGRELLELHTLGVDGGYTQHDVIHAARALTGWTINGPRQGGGFAFVPFMHDAGEKRVLGHTLKAGRGIEDGEELLNIVARHPSTARFIATKLVRRFVSDTPPQALVDRAAATFTRSDGDIRAVVRLIVTSPEFFAREAYRAKVKSPFEVVVSALRALNAQPDRTPRTAQFVAGLGQPIFGRSTPDGWPDTAEGWLGTGAILNRINFGLVVAAGRVPGANPMAVPGADQLRQAPRDQQVEAVVHALLGGDASPITRSVLLTGKHPLLDAAPDARMTDAPPLAAMTLPNAGEAVRGAARGAAPLPPLRGLAQVLGLALGSPEFQRR
jgi:uncharacterized protein (DUF1800 family)